MKLSIALIALFVSLNAEKTHAECDHCPPEEFKQWCSDLPEAVSWFETAEWERGFNQLVTKYNIPIYKGDGESVERTKHQDQLILEFAIAHQRRFSCNVEF